MDLKKYLFSLPQDERQTFAKKVGTTAKHLTNVAYGWRPLAPTVCLAIETETNGTVSRQDLRPKDFWLIWPDLSRFAPTESAA